MAPARRRERLQRLPLPMLGLVVALMAGEWVLLVASKQPQEMLVGALSVFAGAIFLYYVHRTAALRIKLRFSDLVTAWRLPGEIAVDSFVIIKVLFQDLFRVRKAASFYRVAGFQTGKHDPVMVGRRVLATLYTTASPNSIVVAIDPEQSRLLFHQLERRPLSAVTRELGARP